jgi:hypothetical protein
VANKNNIIVLNGNRYDAASGTIVGAAAKTASGQPRLVDNFVRSADTPAKKGHIHAAKKLASTNAKNTRTHRVAAQSVSPKPQSAKTLMRSAVKKPVDLYGPHIKTQAPVGTSIVVTTPKSSLHKTASQSIDAARMLRSKQVTKPAAIQRFTSPDSGVFGGSVFSSQVASPATQHQQIQPSYNSVPVSKEPMPVYQPKPSQNIFERALADSKSHEQTFHGSVSTKVHSKKRQHAGFAALMIAVLVLAGFVAYINAPALSMSVASARAGFHATVPGYLPPGFSAQKLTYVTDSVSTQYKSNTDNRNFIIVQKSSDWDSNALLSNFVTVSNLSYQTYQTSETNGRTVYVYGDGNATWVDGGIWYTVMSNGSLPTRQLIDIAAGL